MFQNLVSLAPDWVVRCVIVFVPIIVYLAFLFVNMLLQMGMRRLNWILASKDVSAPYILMQLTPVGTIVNLLAARRRGSVRKLLATGWSVFCEESQENRIAWRDRYDTPDQKNGYHSHDFNRYGRDLL